MENAVIKRCFCMAVALAALLTLEAQTYYSCDFEDEQENAQWVMNAGNLGKKCKNKWFIGEGAHNGGRKGMYISNDSVTPSYIAVPTIVSAYRPLTLSPGEYTLSLDWQAFGFDPEDDALYVCWMPDSLQVVSSDNALSMFPWIEEWALDFGKTTGIRLNSSPWQSSTAKFLADGTPYNLVFVWVNGGNGIYPPPACVDNIMIMPESECSSPTSIDIETSGSDVIISWKGSAPTYDLRIKNGEDGNWTEYPQYPSTLITLPNIEEGLIDVYVRSVCDANTVSPWVSKNQFIYFKGTRCIEYLDLESAHGSYLIKNTENEVQGILDAGYASYLSRHTIHYHKGVYDPRTNGQLLMVPDDEVASVRLGNWDVNNEHESIEYDFHVDAETNAILLLKYAVVLQEPDHNPEEQPFFSLSIREADGTPLGEYGCAEALFTSGFNTSDWEVVPELEVNWKDWTIVGINLQEYDGMDLKIKLSTYDCTLGGHYGYAYFTLSCDDGQIKGLSCGESDMNSFQAPDGFNYEWFDSINPEVILGTEQVFSVKPDDTRTYGCNVIQPTNENCYYTVYARAIPRYPVSACGYKDTIVDCQNVVRFTNDSYVAYVDPETNDTTVSEDMCDSVLWDFGDGTVATEWEPEHTFPQEGGTFTVTLKSMLADCDDVKTFEIELPRLGTVTDTTHVVVCGEEGKTPYTWSDGNNMTYYYSDTVEYAIVNEVTGCDSVSVLDLIYCAPYDTVIYDTICSGESVIIDGREVFETGVYTIDTVNAYGCDSITTIDLTVNESLVLDMDEEFSFCADDGSLVLPYVLSSGQVTTFKIDFADEAMSHFNADSVRPVESAVSIEVDTALLPGRYPVTLVFANRDCGDQTKEAVINVHYPDSVVVQRWNDLLGVRNADYNGGYEFVAYQWYENGAPLTGEIGANLYRPDGLNTASEYSVMLTRLSDNVSVLTCPVVPQLYSDIEVMPTVTFIGSSISVKSSIGGEARMWTATGVLVSTFGLSGDVSTVAAPSAAGTYLLEIRLDDGTVRTEKIIVKSYN